jgi:predicted nucleotidyltransferase
VDLLLHPAEDTGAHRPDPRGRLSTVGHTEAFKAFARVAQRAGVRFMVIGGTFRDIAVRAASTRDIDIVLVDRQQLPAQAMRKAGFTRVPRSQHAWRYVARGRTVDLEIAAVASSEPSAGEPRGPFSVAYEHARTAKIEGVTVPVPRIEDYVILKLLAAVADRRRLTRDLADVQYALAAFPETAQPSLSISALRGRLRDLYGVRGPRLHELVALLRETRRLLKR